MQTVLGIDLGTQSVKVVFYDFENRSVAATASSPLALDQDASGKAEQDPASWLAALRKALSEISAATCNSVVAIGVSGQQHGLVALDHNGQTLRPAKLWCDTTTRTEADAIMATVGGRERCITISGNALVTGFTAPKILWLKQHEPERYAAMTDILLPHDYLNFILTSEKAME